MRHLVSLGIVAMGLFCSTAAHADTIYNLNLTSPNNSGGSGSFSLNVAPSTAPGSVTTYYATGNGPDILDSFSISIAGLTFDLGNAIEAPSVQFTGGVLSSITYGSSIGNTAFQIVVLQYAVFSTSNPSGYQVGNITATPVASVATTPEPSGIALLGTGLLGVAGVVKRRLV